MRGMKSHWTEHLLSLVLGLVSAFILLACCVHGVGPVSKPPVEGLGD